MFWQIVKQEIFFPCLDFKIHKCYCRNFLFTMFYRKTIVATEATLKINFTTLNLVDYIFKSKLCKKA